MVSTRMNTSQIAETPKNPNAHEKKEDDGQRKEISNYEQSREERIKENLERMQKLGILDLSLKLKSFNPIPKRKNTPSLRKTPKHFSPLPPSGSVRRSSRLKNATPVTYSDVYLTKNDKYLDSDADWRGEVGSKPEVYTEEHVELLGNTEMSWTLFVDGCGKDGKRIYDPVNGKTCHQCRQKTLGLRTHCCKCNMVQGQCCGDCLYMRYGEHVLEANQNPNWICPVCRRICNCSLCRQAKGWPPTGPLYRKISSLGYKSVAHYLIQTRRTKTETEADSNTKVTVPVERSLPFSHVEPTLVEKVSLEFDHNPQCLKNTESDDAYDSSNLSCKNRAYTSKKPELHASSNDQKGELQVELPVNERGQELEVEKQDQTCPKSNKRRVRTTEPDADSIGGRLRQRRDKGNEQMIREAKNETLDVKEIHIISSPGKSENAVRPSDDATTPDVAPVTSPKCNKKRLQRLEPSPDSIAGRLRRRRSEGKSSGVGAEVNREE